MRKFTRKSEQGGRPPMIKSKVVVRNLPVDMPREDFEAILEMKGIRTTCISQFVAGKKRKNNRASIPARGYLDVKKDRQLLALIFQQLPKYEFKSSEGHMISLQVDYAPYQKFPKKNITNHDPLENTIEQDGDYQLFLEKLAKEPEKLPSAEAQLDAKTHTDTVDEEPVPLVQYLRERQANNLLTQTKRGSRRFSKKGKGGKKTGGKKGKSNREEISPSKKSKRKNRKKGAWKKKKEPES